MDKDGNHTRVDNKNSSAKVAPGLLQPQQPLHASPSTLPEA